MLWLGACGRTDPGVPDQDQDGDGLVASADCDDTDPAQGGAEVPYDGVDNDCDATTPDDDLDGDGHVLAHDCDDADPVVGGREVALDGIDNDCDGVQGLYGDADGDGLALTDDCDDQDPAVGGSNERGVAGDWVGDATADDVTPAFCDGYWRRPITGDLRIEDSDLVDLSDLWCVERVAGDLIVGRPNATSSGAPAGNHRLVSLAGLESLVEVDGDVSIFDAPTLTSVALPSLRSIGGDVVLGSAPALTTLELPVLDQIGGDVQVWQVGLTSLSGLDRVDHLGALVIDDAPALTDLAGLAALTEVDLLSLTNNPALVDVTGLYGLQAVHGDVMIARNHALTDAAAQALVDEIDVIEGDVYVGDNQA
jgi:hypothetical protein